MCIFRLARIVPILLLATSPAFGADRPPEGRWVASFQAGIPATAGRTALCAGAKDWTDLTATEMIHVFDREAVVCSIRRWTKIDARTFEPVLGSCEPEIDLIGDGDGGVRIVLLDSQTMRFNTVIHILCPTH